jgi:hypothetical protein
MIQQMDAFLREFIGYQQDQISSLGIEWQAHNEGLDAAYAVPTLAGSPALVYRAPDGGLSSKLLTEDAFRRCREAMPADIQQMWLLSSRDTLPSRRRRGRRPAQAHRGK